MKKTMILVTMMMAILCGCKSTPQGAELPMAEPTAESHVADTYVLHGYYYTEGYVVDSNGERWDYQTDMVSDTEVYDHMPVYMGMSDNCTPDDIYDDIVKGLVYDRTTAIMDALEDELAAHS